MSNQFGPSELQECHVSARHWRHCEHHPCRFPTPGRSKRIRLQGTEDLVDGGWNDIIASDGEGVPTQHSSSEELWLQSE